MQVDPSVTVAGLLNSLGLGKYAIFLQVEEVMSRVKSLESFVSFACLEDH